MRLHASLRKNYACARFPNRHDAIPRGNGWRPAADLLRRKQFVLEMVSLRARERSLDHEPVRQSNHQPAGWQHSRFRGCLGQLRPKLVSALDDWHINRMLEI